MHVAKYSLMKAIEEPPPAEIVIHLGDGEYDLKEIKPYFPDKHFLQVKGNCDVMSTLPEREELEIEGCKIILTHGHLFEVKRGYERIIDFARDEGAKILLFGHTHTAFEKYDDGLYIINPGSLRGYKSTYATIDITDQGIVSNILTL